MSLIRAAICHIIDPKRSLILLKLADRGVSKGMWNACGGKIEEGETPLACAIREVSEESGLKVSNLVYHGKEVAHLPDKEFLIHIYSTTIFEGELLKDSPEGELHWFPINEIPFEQMWPDDTFWLLPMLRGARFDAEFWYLPDKILERCHFELY